MPDEVTLTLAEVARAQEENDFFLTVVSGLEKGNGDLRVRFIFDPLRRLSVRVSSSLTPSIRRVEALDYVFRPDEETQWSNVILRNLF